MSKPVHSSWHGLQELDIGFHVTLARVSNVALPCAKNLAPHQSAVLQVNLQEFAFDRAEDHSSAGFALRLGKVEADEPAILKVNASIATVSRIAGLERVVRSNQRTILKPHIGMLWHFGMFRAHVGPRGIAPPVQAPKLTAPEHAGFPLAGQHVRHSSTKRSANGNAILHNHAERLCFVHQIEKQTAVPPGDV